MKRILLILLLLPVFVKAQKIHFADTSNVWKEVMPQYDAPNPWIFNYFTYSFAAEQMIDTVAYRQFGFGLVREDSVLNKVYIRSGDSDIVLMDYNLRVGDTFSAPYHRFPVIGVDSTLINSVWHRVWYFPFYTGGWYTGTGTISVIEGIGCIEHPLFMMTDYGSCVECSQPFMYCFSNHGSTPPLSPKIDWFDNSSTCTTYATLGINAPAYSSEHITIYPNPATSSITITAQTTIMNIAITDMVGQNIYSHRSNTRQVQVDVETLPAGVYFVKVNGTEVKKFVKQ